MAGRHRRKFIDIISDTITLHYQGKVAEQELQDILLEVRKHIGKLEQCSKNARAQRLESLRKLKKLPLEKLNELLKPHRKTGVVGDSRE